MARISPVPLPNEAKETYLNRMAQQQPLMLRPTHRDKNLNAQKARIYFGTYYDQYRAKHGNIGAGGRRRRKTHRRRSHRRKTHRRR